MRIIAAAILFVIGSVLSITLHVSVATSEPLFAFLMVLTVTSAFIVYFQNRLKSFTFPQVTVDLEKIELTKNEVIEMQASVKALGKAIHDVFETKAHGIMQESYDADAADAAMAKLKKLIS